MRRWATYQRYSLGLRRYRRNLSRLRKQDFTWEESSIMPVKTKMTKARRVLTRKKIARANGRNGRNGRRPATHKWVYAFYEGNKDMRDLLGGKGAGLAEMTNADLPVPPGFTITTEACNAFVANGNKFPAGMWEQTLAALKKVEKSAGKKFGDPKNPLL